MERICAFIFTEWDEVRALTPEDFLRPYENANHTGRQKLLFCREL